MSRSPAEKPGSHPRSDGATPSTSAGRSPLERLGRIAAGVTVVVGVGSAAFLVASGTRPGAPLLFVVCAAVALCVTLYLLARTAIAILIEPQADEERVAIGRRRKELEREKQLLLKALKELTFDHEMHKISVEDYEKISATYRARAVRIMRQLDEGASAYRKQIEEELARRRDGAAPANARDEAAAKPAPSATSETAAAGPSSPSPASPSSTSDRHACVHCGTANECDAVFCKKCGQRVDAEVHA